LSGLILCAARQCEKVLITQTYYFWWIHMGIPLHIGEQYSGMAARRHGKQNTLKLPPAGKQAERC
jgi:hypothetical protein